MEPSNSNRHSRRDFPRYWDNIIMSTVLLEKREGFAVVTLNRPQSMNALSRQLRHDFVAAFTACTDDPDVRVIILTGNGKAFCAGFDLKELNILLLKLKYSRIKSRKRSTT